MPASAPAARTDRAFPWESGSRRCGWIASRLAAPVETESWTGRAENDRHADPLGENRGATHLHSAAGPGGEGRVGRAILRAFGIDGADLDDRRCAGRDQIPLRLWDGVASIARQCAYNPAHFRRTARARRRGGVSLAWRRLADLGQAC